MGLEAGPLCCKFERVVVVGAREYVYIMYAHTCAYVYISCTYVCVCVCVCDWFCYVFFQGGGRGQAHLRDHGFLKGTMAFSKHAVSNLRKTEFLTALYHRYFFFFFYTELM